MKNSAFRKAVVAPAVFALVLSGSALVASPALALEPTPTPTDSISPSPSASDPVVEPAPVASNTPEPTVVPTAPSTSTPTPTPSVPVAKDLTVTSPKLDTNGTATVHGDRVVTIAGTAPIGSKLEVTNEFGRTIASLTTATTDFSIVVTFTADDSYLQSLSVNGTSGDRALTSVDMSVIFDAETSATPTITSPISGSSYTVAPTPFSGSNDLGALLFSGRGTPGDEINLDTVGGGIVIQLDDIVIDGNGDWSGRAYLTIGGSPKVAATQVRTNADGDPLTRESAPSAPVAITLTALNVVNAPFIKTPSWKDSPLWALSGYDQGTGTDSPDLVVPPKRAKEGAQKPSQLGLGSSTVTVPSAVRQFLGAEQRQAAGVGSSKARAAVGARDDVPTTDEAVADYNEFIDDYGIRVVGTPSKTSVGTVDMTVSGVGSPGRGIVLYEETPAKAVPYFNGLYPSSFGNPDDPEVVNDGSPAPVAPGPGSTGDPASTEKLPAYDGTIRVGADGTWTATLQRVPGNYVLTAFAVDPGTSSNPRYSVASQLLPIKLTGTPSLAVTELAFTGSQVSVAAIIGAVGAVGLGTALTFYTRRRRSL